MILLVISIPFYVSSAYAVLIKSVEVTGKDGIPNFISGTDDNATFNVELDTSAATPITKDEIFLTSQALNIDKKPFQTFEGNTYKYTTSKMGRTSKKYDYEVKVESFDKGTATLKGNFYIDSMPPIVSKFDLKQTVKEISVASKIEDQTCEECDNLGIDKVNLLVNDVVIAKAEKVLDKVPATNKKPKEYNYEFKDTIAALGLTEENNQICVVAYDLMGAKSIPNCKNSITIDPNPPEILGDTLKIFDEKNEYQLFYFTKKPLKFNLHISIADDNLDTNSITADLSSVNFNKKEAYSKLKPTSTCTKHDTEYECVWDKIEYDGKSDLLKVTINAKDYAGNTDTFEGNLPLQKYSQKPTAVRIYNEVDKEAEKLFVKEGKAYLALEINDVVGFHNKNVYLDLNGLQPGKNKQSPDNCTYGGNIWTCWYNVDVTTKQTETSILVHPDSVNDIGAYFSGTYTQKVFVDTVLPEAGNFEKSSPCPTAEEGLEIVFRVSDLNKPSAVMDISAISTDDTAEADCKEFDPEKHVWECVMKISNLVAQHIATVQIEVIVTDPAGNKGYTEDKQGNHVDVFLTLEVCETEKEGIPDLIESITAVDVPKTNKKTLTAIDYPLNLKLTYEFRNKGARILSQTITCNDVSQVYFTDGLDYVDQTTATKTMDGKAIIKNVIFVLSKNKIVNEKNDNLNWDDKGEITSDVLKLECTASAKISNDGKVYDALEEEKFEVEIPLFGLALGDADESMKEKLSSAEDDIKSVGEAIDKWESIVSLLTSLCTMVEIIGYVNTILQGIKSFIWGMCAAMEDVPIIGAAFKALWKGYCFALDGVHGTITKWIWPPNTLPVPPFPGHIFKYICIIVNCKLCDPDLLAEAAAEGISLAVNPEKKAEYVKKETEYVAEKGMTTEEFKKGETKFSGENLVPLAVPTGETNPVYYPSPFSYTEAIDGLFIPDEAKTVLGVGGTTTAGLVLLSTTPSGIAAAAGGGLAFGLLSQVPSPEDTINPFKSYYVATACLCPTAIIFNKKKEQQILCRYKTCLNNAIEAGIPINVCDKLKEQQMCLYYESAAVKAYGAGLIGIFLLQVVKAFLWKALIALALAPFYYACFEYYTPPPGDLMQCGIDPIKFSKSPWCGIGMSALSVLELTNIFINIKDIFDFDKYQKSLSTDYCG